MSVLDTSFYKHSIPRSYFNLSKKHFYTCNAGELIPVYRKLLKPNDLFKIDVEAIVRQNPTISPSYSFHQLKFRWFAVSIRNLNKDFYRFLSGYKEYSLTSKYEEPLHYWKPSSPEKTKPKSLWTSLGGPANCIPDDESLPLDYFRLSYNYIYNEFFRNQTLQDSILPEGDPSKSTNEDILLVNWDRNYFTTCLPLQQLSDPIGVGLVGNTKAVFSESFTENLDKVTVGIGNTTLTSYSNVDGYSNSISPNPHNHGASVLSSAINRDKLLDYLNNNTVDLSQASMIKITDLMSSFALQTMATMNAFGGIRDNEFLDTHWGISPSDETLGRPYYLGGSTVNVLTSEVLQTSQTTKESPQGNLSGHGLGVGRSKQIRFHAKEFCVLLCLAYIKPETTYGSQGIARELTLRSRFDFPFPIFSRLAAQPVFLRELMCASSVKMDRDYKKLGDDDTAKTYNSKIAGWRPVFDWCRFDNDSIDGQFLLEQFYKADGSLDYKYNDYNWTESQFFSIKDGERPLINDSFLKCKPDKRNYTLTDDKLDADSFKIALQFHVHTWQALPKVGIPVSLAG